MSIRASVLLYGPQGTGKTLVAVELAKHLKLGRVMDSWRPDLPYPDRDTLVIAECDEEWLIRQFGGRRIHIDEAMSLLQTTLVDVIERARAAARQRCMH